jgi:hypothetical protein
MEPISQASFKTLPWNRYIYIFLSKHFIKKLTSKYIGEIEFSLI